MLRPLAPAILAVALLGCELPPDALEPDEGTALAEGRCDGEWVATRLAGPETGLTGPASAPPPAGRVSESAGFPEPEGWLAADLRSATGTESLQGFSTDGVVASYSGLSGAGVRVAVVDSGVDGSVLDLHAFDALGNDLGSRVSGAAPPPGASNLHGTFVASVLAGNGQNSAAFSLGGVASPPFAFRGQAPRASLLSFFKGAPWGGILEADLSSHSYPLSNGTYSAETRTVDGLVRSGLGGLPPRPIVFAAGNSGMLRGYHSTEAVAKNAIVVGGSNANDDGLWIWSSLGPTLDGRIKPDLVAPAGKDPRPPAGFGIAIDEIRLRARAGSGAPDRVWGFEAAGDLEGWSLGPGLEQGKVQGGLLVARATLGGADPAPPSTAIGGGPLLQEGLSIDAASYDRLELRIRFEHAPDGEHGWPRLWAVRFRNGAGEEHTVLATYAATEKSQDWRSVEVSLPSSIFSGTVSHLELEPAIFLDGIVAAQAGTQSYTLVAGTSFAAPAVSGALALLLEQLGRRRDAAVPWPSTLRALLLHTTRDLIHEGALPRDRENPDTGAPTLAGPGPDHASGFGLLDARAASSLLAAHRPSAPKLVEARIGEGELHRYRLALPARARELRATLVWDDAPGSPLLPISEPQLVNDLDLVALAPSSGRAHGPWILDPLPLDPKTAHTGLDPIRPEDVRPARSCLDPRPFERAECEDHRNNVEQVLVLEPAPGEWTILVRGHGVPRGPQRYSLIVSARCE